MSAETIKLSVVILCWNSRQVIGECLTALFAQETPFTFEVLVADNASTDGTAAYVRSAFPAAKVIENGANLGFSAGNNRAFAVARGEYFLVLNPDTVARPRALASWIEFADAHPEGGAFGCRVIYPDGKAQHAARPFPTPFRLWLTALGLRVLGYFSPAFHCDTYLDWKPDRTREVDWVSGCSLLLRGKVARKIGGFDEKLFYHFDDIDLCKRVRQTGRPILYAPTPVIAHVGGNNNVGRLPLRLEIEKCRNMYRYFLKHYGLAGARRVRRSFLAKIALRAFYYRFKPGNHQRRLEIYRGILQWNRALELAAFQANGAEPPVPFDSVDSSERTRKAS